MNEEHIIESILERIGQALMKKKKEPMEAPEPYPVEDESHIERIEKPNNRFVLVKPKMTDKALLLEMEAIKRDREAISKQKQEIAKRQAQVEDQHYSLKKAQQETNGRR
jgi:hypothetical protein